MIAIHQSVQTCIKTIQALALRIALHHLILHPLDSVLWIDTTGSFSAKRADAILIAVLENGQQADGSVDLPAALHPYLGGATRLGTDVRLA